MQCCSVGVVGVGCTLVGGQFTATGLWTGCRGSNELSSVSSKIWADGRDLSDPMDTAAGLATANDRKKMVMITTIEEREQIFSQNYNSTPTNPTQAHPQFLLIPHQLFFFSSTKFFLLVFKKLLLLLRQILLFLNQISSYRPPNCSSPKFRFSSTKYLLI